MKDEKAWPHQVELSLDNRQIFLLFFASAVLLSLVFALGVVVGKRQGVAPARAGSTDPLALLDQMGGDDTDENLSYQQTLSPGVARVPAKSQAPAAAASDPAQTPVASTAAKAPAVTPPAVVAPVPPGAARSAHAPQPAVAPSEPKAEKPRREGHAARRQALPADAGEVKLAGGGKDKAVKPNKDEAQAATDPAEAGYTLQLSSFQEKREAEAFMAKLRQGGLKPYMTPTTIPGRGVWFRVRLGRYKSWDDAVTAKQTFEQQQKMIAYVSK